MLTQIYIHTRCLSGRPCCSASVWITALCDGVHRANQMFQMSLGLPRSPSLGAPQQDRGYKGEKIPQLGKKRQNTAPNLAKQMSTLATVNTSGEWYANECTMCLRASLPAAGERGPMGGWWCRSHRERQERRQGVPVGCLNVVWLALSILAIASFLARGVNGTFIRACHASQWGWSFFVLLRFVFGDVNVSTCKSRGGSPCEGKLR